ncbi:MAG: hypothetical protein J1E34_08205 [Oscillospiraceae bacterium]|nr:hypothetical protein [Oscillospiraceae bacterium]
MHIKNGILTTLRAKGRAVLFVLLILILTLTQTLGVGMWVYCSQLLEKFDETYTTIVISEYIGEDYPDMNAADEDARAAFSAIDGESLSKVEGVANWEFTDTAFAYSKDYTRAIGTIPYAEYGVFIASGLFESTTGDYSGFINNVIYTKENKENVLVLIDKGETDFAPEEGKKYLLHGFFIHVSSNRTFVLTGFSGNSNAAPWIEVSGLDDPAIQNSLFIEAAKHYALANNAAIVTASNDIASLEQFQQGTLYLEDGRLPLADEKGVCVLSGSTAQRMKKNVGDEVEFNILNSSADNRYDLTESDDNRVWKVVGVTNNLSDYEGYIWVSGSEGGFSSPFYGYTLGSAVLNNSMAPQALSEMQALMPDNVRLTLYDQGYSAAARPINAMKTTSSAVATASFCGALAVLFLFAYMFVGRQRETVQVLVSLGAPAKKIHIWLLSGAALIAFISSAAGAIIGHLSLGIVIKQALALAASLYTMDIRYSNASLGIVKESPVAGSVPIWCSAAVGGATLLAALLLCVVFLRQARKESTPKRGKSSIRVPKDKTSTFGRGAARFSLLSAKRGGKRSSVVPAAALVLTILIGILAVGSTGWEDQLNDLYENSTIQGQIVSLNGRYATNLVVNTSTARALWKSGLLSDIGVSKSWNYWISDEMPSFANNEYGRETKINWISEQPELTATNAISAIPEFYYSDKPEIQWLEGWDESFLADDEFYSILRTIIYSTSLSHYFGGDLTPTYPVLASRSFMENKSLELGDEIIICSYIAVSTPDYLSGIYTSEYEMEIPVKIVGSFQQIGQNANLYVPLSFWCDPAWITGDEDILTHGDRVPTVISDEEERDKFNYHITTFKTCRFTLSSTDNLEEFRSFLETNGYSSVGNINTNRTTILLLDSTFQEAADSLSRYISFGKILFPVLFAVVALMGFVISWLMVNSRRMEFAILRGLGASKWRVFKTFFFEQAALCISGSLIAALGMTILYPIPAVWLTAAGFTICYLLGCALSILYVSRIKLMTLLSERE